ncbi:Smr/MutS family protein [Acetobacter cibinongensis]|uniref:Methionine ABC transporter substrate-binding protein n=1 Tax=Acetobacter cibinongensis TaxID=146475 RepID=A0A1Z5YSQ2_9PROT|nr:Smr/MutS family protein [Acetobacter cibinongensis]OUJ01202.1 methionine ABC transporter substrate-binding protein [Acetobacter cibinongensis]
MVRRRQLREEEKALWHHVMRDVAPLHDPISEESTASTPVQAPAVNTVTAAPRKPKPACALARKARALPEVDMGFFIPPKPMVEINHKPHPTDAIGKRYPGVDNYSWRTFSDGGMRVQRRLDLHGMVAQDAFRRLMEFMDVAHMRGLRCVEIVTGLGTGAEGGILRRELPHWLGRPEIRNRVLGLTYPHAGNKGSVRVLLRRRRA